MGRFQFVLRRIVLTVPLLLGIVLLVFLVLKLTPGDPARQIVGLRASQAQLDQVRQQLGLNDSVLVQYVHYVGRLLHGDLGYSFKSLEPVRSVIADRLPVSLWLMSFGAAFALLISVPLGTLAGLRPNSATDHVIRGVGLLGLTMPSFWVGIVLILLVALPSGVLPAGGFGDTPAEHLRAIILPALTLAISIAPIQVRSLRASLVDVRAADYMTTGRSLGLSESRLLRRFTLRNAMPPTMSVLALNMGYLLFGAVVIETTFALPGIGQGMVLAARGRDLPMIQGYTLLFAVLVVGVYLLADIATAMLDPRVEIQA